MESKTRTEELVKEVAELEIEYAAAKEEAHVLENNEKLRLHKKSMMEVKLDDLSKSLESYRKKFETLRQQLKKERAKHSRLSLAEQYYGKFLADLPKDSDLQTHKYTSEKEKDNCVDGKKQIEELEKEIEIYQEQIQANNVLLLSMGDEVEVYS